MNTFSYQVFYPSARVDADTDWLTCSWGGPYTDEEDDEAPAACGYWSCPGDCSVCIVCEVMHNRLFLPIYGPVNKDGAPLGFLIVT